MKKSKETIVPSTWGEFLKDQLKLIPGTLGYSVMCICVSIVLGYLFVVLRNHLAL